MSFARRRGFRYLLARLPLKLEQCLPELFVPDESSACVLRMTQALPGSPDRGSSRLDPMSIDHCVAFIPLPSSSKHRAVLGTQVPLTRGQRFLSTGEKLVSDDYM